MLKKLLALISVMALAGLCYPDLSGNGIVTVGGKSAGRFIAFSCAGVSDVINCDGLSLTLSDKNYGEIVKKYSAKLVHVFESSGVKNLYFYSEKLTKSEIVFGKKVNLHVAIRGEVVTVGSPLIYYAY